MASVKTTEELRQDAAHWTLAGDVELRKHLEALANSIENKAKQLEQSLTNLETQLLATQTAVGKSLLNHFHP